MKQYTVKKDAVAIASRIFSRGHTSSWSPTRDQWKSKYVLEVIAGKTFVSLDHIQGGIVGMIYLLIGNTGKATSQVMAIPPELVEYQFEDGSRVDPPTEYSKSGWWVAEQLVIVRLLVFGFTDGFMAFIHQSNLSAEWVYIHGIITKEVRKPPEDGVNRAPAWYWADDTSNKSPSDWHGPYLTEWAALEKGWSVRKEAFDKMMNSKDWENDTDNEEGAN